MEGDRTGEEEKEGEGGGVREWRPDTVTDTVLASLQMASHPLCKPFCD